MSQGKSYTGLENVISSPLNSYQVNFSEQVFKFLESDLFSGASSSYKEYHALISDQSTRCPSLQFLQSFG